MRRSMYGGQYPERPMAAGCEQTHRPVPFTGHLLREWPRRRRRAVLVRHLDG